MEKTERDLKKELANDFARCHAQQFLFFSLKSWIQAIIAFDEKAAAFCPVYFLNIGTGAGDWKKILNVYQHLRLSKNSLSWTFLQISRSAGEAQGEESEKDWGRVTVHCCKLLPGTQTRWATIAYMCSNDNFRFLRAVVFTVWPHLLKQSCEVSCPLTHNIRWSL